MSRQTKLALGLVGAAAGGIIAWRVASRLAKPGVYAPAADRAATALITGASAGIGAAFAQRLARDGYNLILVARRRERLEHIASDLARQHGVTVEALEADLAQDAGIERVERRIADLDRLDLLVNNAGFGTLGRFAELPIQLQLDMLTVHVLATVRLTRAALPAMLERRSGAIVNVSSIAPLLPGQGNVIYNAAKAGVTSFSESLHMELEGTGVVAQALCPGMTSTEFHDTPLFKQSGFRRSTIPAPLWMPAEAVVECSLRELGRAPVCIPGAHNRLLAFLPRVVPGSMLRAATRAFIDKVEPKPASPGVIENP